MTQDTTLSRNELFSSMESDKPYASYIKTILGKVGVTVWDNILDKPIEVILEGNPKKKDDGCIVKVWSAKENLFFKRTNVHQFKKGRIIPYQMPIDAVEEKIIEQSTDEELEAIVNSKYFTFINKLNEISAVAVLFRMKSVAEDNEKSAKIIDAIEKRISELQAAEYPKVLEVEPNIKED